MSWSSVVWNSSRRLQTFGTTYPASGEHNALLIGRELR